MDFVSKLISQPIFKYGLVLLLGAIGGWFFSDWYTVDGLRAKLEKKQETIAELKAERDTLRLQSQSAAEQVKRAEKQCEGLIEHERTKPKSEINATVDVTDDYLDSVFGGMQRKDGSAGKADNPGTRGDSKAPATGKR